MDLDHNEDVLKHILQFTSVEVTTKKAIAADIINSKRMIFGPGHHMCHAHSAFWQSPFDKAWLVSSDGGGNDGFFNIYHCDKKTGPTPDEQIDRFDFGTIYGLIGAVLPQVGKSTRWFYDVAGKAMALAGQWDGKVPEELILSLIHISEPTRPY